MCNLFGGDPPVDNSAAIARQQEDARQANINTGKQKIDSAFSVFDPGYFDKYQKAYTDNYNPQLDYQYGQAKQNLTYDTARAGTQDSSGGQKQFSDLVGTYLGGKQQIASNAADATNTLRNSVDQQKTALYGQNISAADPALAAESALSSSNSLGRPAQYSPLGNFFAGAVTGTANAISGQGNQIPAAYRTALNTPGSTLPGASSSVVR